MRASVMLTAQGEMLLTYARRMITLSNEAVSRFVMPGLAGIVRLGAPEDIGEQRLLPGILNAFCGDLSRYMVDTLLIPAPISTSAWRRSSSISPWSIAPAIRAAIWARC